MSNFVNGRAQAHIVLPGDMWLPYGLEHSNTLMYEWAEVICELLQGEPSGDPYKLSAMFILFENNGGAAISNPTFTRDEGKSYFDGLSADAFKDYLRVPITAITRDSTDSTNFPNGNRLVCIAQTSGTAGVHGKPFNASVSSRVFGGAIVATPDYSDASQDLVFARFNLDVTAHKTKVAGSQVGIIWRGAFT